MNTYYLGLDLNLLQSIKVLKVKKELGFSGFGLYVALLLKLGQSPNYELAITDYDLLAYELRLESKYIKSLVENYDLFVIKNGKFYCPDVKEKMQLLENKRKSASEAGKLGNQIRWGKVSGSDNNPTSGSDNKPDRNKGNKGKKINKIKKDKYLDCVFLSLDEFEKLKTGFGETKTKKMIEHLNNYKEANGKNYKSDYHAILNWVVKAVEQEQPKGLSPGDVYGSPDDDDDIPYVPFTPLEIIFDDYDETTTN